MKNPYIFLILLVLLTGTILAEEIYSEYDPEGNIILFPFKSLIRGQTEINALVELGELKQLVGSNGRFEFINLDEGRYILKITKEGLTPFITEIEVGKGVVIDLGYIALSGNETNYRSRQSIKDIDYVDITDPNYMEFLIEQKKEKEKRGTFFEELYLGNYTIDLKTAYLFSNYTKNIEGKTSSKANTSGFMVEGEYKLPFNIYGHKMFFGLDIAYMAFGNSMEKVYNNNALTNTLMTDLTHLNYDFMLGYIYPYRYLGDIYVNVGRTYDNINQGISSFELSERPELYTKEYRNSKGWILGGGIETDLETIGLKTNIPILDNMKLGMFYNYCPTLTYITTTKHFSNMLVEGRKHEFDMYLTLDLDYELTLGYKYLNYYNNDQTDGMLAFPDFKSTVHAPYFNVNISF